MPVSMFAARSPFMEQVLLSLNKLGVAESRIHYEFFGPKQEFVSTVDV